MSDNVENALWGKKDGGARRRVAAVAVIAVAAALAGPALARAADVPSSLLAAAQANPTQSFDVIVETADPAQNPVQVTVDAVTAVPQQSFDDAVQAASDAAGHAADLAAQATDAQNQATAAQQAADDAAAQAAETGSPDDQDAAAQAQADADSALAAAQAAQSAAASAQMDAMIAQMTVLEEQANSEAATAQAQSEVTAEYTILPAVAATVTGDDIVSMQASEDIQSVTPDTPVAITSNNNDNFQKWVNAVQVKQFWASPQRHAAIGHTPTIAIVDSGIDTNRYADFGNRLIGQVNLVSSGQNSPGDGRGHGTMVADIASGSNPMISGADPDAPLISLDVIDDTGMGHTSDVIAAADWILANHARYNIRVANFSLQAANESSFMYDPLDQAVEQLWMHGVVVVAAAGNYAVNGAQSGVYYAPANDPFVITVGAADIKGDAQVGNDVAAPWSAWGYTHDGFLKPEISAPGRYIIAACSRTDTLCALGGLLPDLLRLGQGYNELSGTSFAAPMVSAAAAAILALHPSWTPDQVKGQLMLTANAMNQAVPGSVGVGELDMNAATGPAQASPPNPNQALDQFIANTSIGPVFDAASWTSAAQSNASWSSASWSSASWSSASWSSASWSSASWTSASWTSASWTSASWTSASWTSSSSELSLPNNASEDTAGDG